MKHFLFKPLIGLSLASWAGVACSAATSVVVYGKDGVRTAYNVSSEGKVYFNNSDLFIESAPGSNAAKVGLGSIAKVMFAASSGSDALAADAGRIDVVPCAVVDRFSVSGLSEAAEVSLYSASGVWLLSQKLEPGDSVDVSDLPQGVYIVKVYGLTFKITKI